MATLKSRIHEEGKKQYLELLLPDGSALIPLTEDKPQSVKDVFNRLILLLKKNPVEFEFSKGTGDLYSQIAQEYVQQLNTELEMIRQELNESGLTEADLK
jgi:hypothetical protein